ncbi:MAG: phosphatase PAP2 family protein [Spirochaetaceae bacterium]|nr:phosphatase PAP2 family protein [Spirochaetaceae bacterium]
MITSFAFCEIPNFFSGDAGVFKLDPVYDGIIGGGGLALTGGMFIYDKVTDGAEYNGTTPLLSTVNAFDRWAAQPYSDTLHLTGTLTEIVAMASPAILAFTDVGEWGIFTVMYAESLLWANGLKELAKTLVFRERPYMYFEGAPEDKIADGDFARSFPSGHATMAFNGAVFTSYVFAKYFPDSKLKIPVIATSMSFAVATAVQRVLSGNHFITDVLAGAFLGSVTGFVVPFLHTLPLKNDKINITATPISLSLRYSF